MFCACRRDVRESKTIAGKFSAVIASRPIGSDQSVWCVASTLTCGLGCGHRFVIRSTVDLFRFCVSSLTGRWAVLENTQGKDSGAFR